ncbi:MAG: type VI secretion system ImpA family N-terminal domain-containing protein, partial [Planctomycetota bacterium]
MADIDFEALTTPISDDAPCGPDLDEEFDMDFMNFVAELEGNLPTSYFKFEPADFPFDKSFEQIGELTERTRDLRLLVPLAKLYALRGNLEGMAKTLDGVHRLLAEHFHDLHPRPMDGDYSLRNGYLFTIDDMPNAVLPFQHAPLVRSRRHGAITVRKFQVASGDVNAREDEDTLDLSSIHTAMAEAEATEIEALRENLALLKSALSGISNVTIAEAGFEDAVRLEKLPSAIDVALEVAGLAGGDAAEAGAVDDASGGAGAGAEGGVQTVRVPTGAVATREAAVAAMFAAEKYFATSEPSSPAPLLLRYAQALAVKSFNELVTDLIPDFASSAMVSLGRDPYFQVQLSAIEANHPAPDYDGSGAGEEAASDGWSSWEAAGLDDEEVSEDADPAADDAETAEAGD